MVLPNKNMDNDPVAEVEELLNSAFSDFEAAADGYLKAIESGQDEELRRTHPDLTPAWWYHLQLLGEGKTTREQFLRWLMGVQPPKGEN